MALGLQALSNHLSSLRHGGASDDMLRKRRSISAIKERGRWVSDSSLSRYAKATLLQKEVNKVPATVTSYGIDVEARFAEHLTATILAVPPPMRPPVVVWQDLKTQKRKARK